MKPNSHKRVQPSRATALGCDSLEFVSRRAAQLQASYINQDSAARAALARLRQAATGRSGASWPVGEYLIPDFLRDDTEDGHRYGDSPDDRAEIAIHVAMTSFAELQQGKSQRMHIPGIDLGKAAKLLSARTDERMDQGAVWQRLAKAAQAESVSGLQRHLRNLIGLLGRRDIGLDFGQLAKDIYDWQDRSYRSTVQRRWSRSFFRTESSAKNSDDSNDVTPTETTA